MINGRGLWHLVRDLTTNVWGIGEYGSHMVWLWSGNADLGLSAQSGICLKEASVVVRSLMVAGFVSGGASVYLAGASSICSLDTRFSVHSNKVLIPNPAPSINLVMYARRHPSSST